MSQLPTITSYGQYKSSNYGVNTLLVDLGNLKLWYSYRTIVAFQDCTKPLSRHNPLPIVSQNQWSRTTGKHLNWIDRGYKEAKVDRLPREKFESKLFDILKSHNLV